MAPLAPGVFSTMTGTLNVSPRYLASDRVPMSVPLPAPNGTTSVISREVCVLCGHLGGQSNCAGGKRHA